MAPSSALRQGPGLSDGVRERYGEAVGPRAEPPGPRVRTQPVAGFLEPAFSNEQCAHRQKEPSTQAHL